MFGWSGIHIISIMFMYESMGLEGAKNTEQYSLHYNGVGKLQLGGNHSSNAAHEGIFTLGVQ